jgi:hypothetical protein
MRKTWNKEEIKGLLQTNDKMIAKSLIELYKKQTQDEQITESTNHTNNQGFTSGDAKRMTSMAKWTMTRNNFLTQKQIDWLRPRLIKYSAQLARIANERELEKV